MQELNSALVIYTKWIFQTKFEIVKDFHMMPKQLSTEGGTVKRLKIVMWKVCCIEVKKVE